MKFAVALIASAATLVAAGDYHSGNETETETAPVEYTTEVVTEYTTYCPEPTTITDGDNTITVTEPTTITITHCPTGCTIEKPIYTTSSVICNECPGSNATATYEPTVGIPEPTAEPTFPVEAGAAKLAGAGLAAFAGVVAFVL